SHHSLGSCSDQSGCGEDRLNGVVALPTTRPSGSMSSALAPVVDRSIPSRSVIRDVPFNISAEGATYDSQGTPNARHIKVREAPKARDIIARGKCEAKRARRSWLHTPKTRPRPE